MSNDPAQAEAIVSDYVATNEAYIRVKAEREAAREKLLSLFPREEGRHEMVTGPWKASVEFPGKMKWDSEQLAAFYGTDAPAHVKRVLSIDLRDYNRLPQSEKEILSQCFTHALGTPKIEVEVK